MRLCALTVIQPWATWIMLGGKDRENRSWRPPLPSGAPLVIHAGKGWDAEAWSCRADYALPPALDDLHAYPLGAIIGVVIYGGVVRDPANRWAVPGMLHWQLSNPRPCPPLDCRGAQGLWDVPAELAAQLRTLGCLRAEVAA